MYQIVASGSIVGNYNATLTPIIPAFTPGNLGLLFTASYIGSLSTPTIAGWQLLSPSVNAKQIALYGRILASGDASPSITWGAQFSCAWINTYSGNPASITGIVHASGDKTEISSNFITYAGISITAPGCLIIAAGVRDKTSTTDSGTFGSLSGFTLRNQSVHSGTAYAAVLNDQIQTAATTIMSETQNLSVSESSNLPYESFTVALYPASTVAPARAKVSNLALLGVG